MTADLIAHCLANTATEYGSSRASEWRRCQVAHHLAHVSRIVPNWRLTASDDAPEYFGIGGLVHSALHYLHLGGDPAELIEYCYTRDDGTDMGVVVEAERLVRAYMSHYDCDLQADDWGTRCGWGHGTTHVASEHHVQDNQRFAMPESRRLDLVVRTPAGELMVVDHKTRSSAVPGAPTARNPQGDSVRRDDYVRGLAVRPAILGQSWLAMQEWKLATPPPVMLNVIVKTKIPQFARVIVRIELAQLERWLRVRDVEAAEQAHAEPVPNWDACAPEIGGKCTYFKWCHGSALERESNYTKQET